jgi:aspartate aminotransferase
MAPIDMLLHAPTGDAGRAFADLAGNTLARGLAGSAILKIAGEIRAAQAAGRPICDLTVGDFSPREFPIPERLLHATQAALGRGETNYPPSEGIPALRQAVVELYRRDLGLGVPLESVVIASGARPFIFSIYGLFLERGDKVLAPSPSWNNSYYIQMSGAQGITPVCGPESRFLPTAELLAPHLPETRLLVLCSPSNPCGTAFDSEELRRICDLVVDENRARERAGRAPLLVMYDQVYWMLTFGGTRHCTPIELRPEMAAYTFLVDGISKSFAATGLRVGYCIVPPALAPRFKAYVGHMGAWAPKAEQVATAELLRDPEGIAAFLHQTNAGIERRLSLLHDGFSALAAQGFPVHSIPPMGAIYLSAAFDILGRRWRGRVLETGEDIRSFLLEEAGFGVVPFYAFGSGDRTPWVRLSTGSVSVADVEAGVQRIGAALARALG